VLFRSRLVVQVNSSVSGVEAVAPARFALLGTRPNPANGPTAIRFALPKASPVLLEIFDVGGRRLRTLADGRMDAGIKSLVWDGRDGQGREAGSGIYFYKLQAGEFGGVRKITLVR
jgi:hypothetical protein